MPEEKINGQQTPEVAEIVPEETKDDLKSGGRTIKQAANLMFMAPGTLKEHIRLGTIKAYQHQPGTPGSKWYVPEEEIRRVRRLLSKGQSFKLPPKVAKMDYVDKSKPQPQKVAENPQPTNSAVPEEEGLFAFLFKTTWPGKKEK